MQDAPGRAGAPLPRQRAEEQGERPTTRRRCAGTATYIDWRSRATRQPRRTTSCSAELLFEDTQLRRGGDRVREDGVRLSGAREERRRRLRGAAGLRASRRSAPPARRHAEAAARRRRQRAALRRSVPRRHARRLGADQRRREAVRAEGPSAPPRWRRAWSTLDPPARRAQRRVAWTVIAHTAFEGGTFDQAEKGYGEVLALTPRTTMPRATNWSSARPRRSTSRASRRARTASCATPSGTSPASPTVAPHVDRPRHRAVRRRCRADRAEGLGRRRRARWKTSASASRTIRCRPTWRASSPSRTSRRASGRRPRASSSGCPPSNKDPKLARDCAVAGRRAVREGQLPRSSRAKAYERYLKQYPQPLEPAIEARYRLATMAKDDGNAGARGCADARDLQQADHRRRRGRTDRTRYLGAMAALAMAEPVADDVQEGCAGRAVGKTTLKTKKAKMEEALQGLCRGRRVRRRRRLDRRDLPHRRAVPGLRQGDARPRSGRRSCRSSSSSSTTCCSRNRRSRSRRRRSSCTRSTPSARPMASTTSGSRTVSPRCAKLRPVRYGKVERSEGVIDAIR